MDAAKEMMMSTVCLSCPQKCPTKHPKSYISHQLISIVTASLFIDADHEKLLSRFCLQFASLRPLQYHVTIPFTDSVSKNNESSMKLIDSYNYFLRGCRF